MKADLELLKDYAETGAENVFTELVRRHAGAVRGAALRQTRNLDMADEVTQAVFIRLAQQAARIKPGSVLLGWLLRTARYAAIDAIRASVRRQRREANMQIDHQVPANAQEDPSEAVWEAVSPHLDAALDSLRGADRNALVLRYFQDKSLAEVGAALGVGEDAARKRVDRALGRLLASLQERGVSAAAQQVVPALLGFAAPAPPLGLVSDTARMALSSAGKTPPPVASLVRSLALRSLKRRLAVWLAAAACAAMIGGSTAYGFRDPLPRFIAGTTGDYRIAGFPDPLPVNRFVAELQNDVMRGNQQSVGLKMHYPLRINTPAGSGTIASLEEFTNRYDILFPPRRIALLLKSPRESLQAEARGVFIEAGAIWIAPEGGPGGPAPRVISINLE